MVTYGLTEYTVQCQICNTLRRMGLMFFKVPNEQKFKLQNARAYACKMKAEGYLAGVADLVVLLDGGICVFLEVKRPAVKAINKNGREIIKSPAGKQSPAQIDFENKVKLLGFNYFVVKSAAEAFAAIEQVKNAATVQSLKVGGTD